MPSASDNAFYWLSAKNTTVHSTSLLLSLLYAIASSLNNVNMDNLSKECHCMQVHDKAHPNSPSVASSRVASPHTPGRAVPAYPLEDSHPSGGAFLRSQHTSS